MIFYKKLWMSFRKRLYLVRGKRFHVKKVKGLLYLLDMRNRVDRQIDAFSIYEKPQVDFLLSTLKNEHCNCFVDIGSHWGYYSLMFANESAFDSAEIHAFEPDDINRNQLFSNLFLNKMQDRIKVYDKAISNSEGELRFHHFDENNRGRSCIADDGEKVVKTTRLDTVLDLKGKVLGIKIDVEGHELDVMSGMTDVLKNNKCILQIESFPDVLPELIIVMSGLGYEKIKTIESDHYFTKSDSIK
ncbi:MAG: FkbM family methyltransferase [Pseudomonadota bacterium]